MKQAELNKLLNTVLSSSAKEHKWKCSRGFLFKATDKLFFSIVIIGQAKQRHLSYRFEYKLLAFDDLFWKIVKLEENQKQPLSFRAAGAWTAPMTRIFEGKHLIPDWDEINLQVAVNEIVAHCNLDAEKISKEVHGLDDNLRLIEKYQAQLKEDYPNAVTNIWRERLLTSILKNEYRDAEGIVRNRIEDHDSGGFQFGKLSFYDLANEYIHSVSD